LILWVLIFLSTSIVDTFDVLRHFAIIIGTSLFFICATTKRMEDENPKTLIYFSFKLKNHVLFLKSSSNPPPNCLKNASSCISLNLKGGLFFNGDNGIHLMFLNFLSKFAKCDAASPPLSSPSHRSSHEYHSPRSFTSSHLFFSSQVYSLPYEGVNLAGKLHASQKRVVSKLKFRR